MEIEQDIEINSLVNRTYFSRFFPIIENDLYCNKRIQPHTPDKGEAPRRAAKIRICSRH